MSNSRQRCVWGCVSACLCSNSALTRDSGAFCYFPPVFSPILCTVPLQSAVNMHTHTFFAQVKYLLLLFIYRLFIDSFGAFQFVYVKFEWSPFAPICFGLRCCAPVRQLLVLNAVSRTFNWLPSKYDFISLLSLYFTKYSCYVHTSSLIAKFRFIAEIRFFYVNWSRSWTNLRVQKNNNKAVACSMLSLGRKHGGNGSQRLHL